MLIIILSVLLTYQDSYTKEILEFRDNLKKTFKNTSTSPLRGENQRNFKNHNFYTIKKEYRITATFSKTPESPRFLIKTTTQRRPEYRVYGVATFTLNNKKHTVQLLEQTNSKGLGSKSILFFPFKDLTNGYTSYTGGRYINVSKPKGNKVVIDFNKSYNPYCAYNENYSCPIPPKENNINAEINAGIKFKNEKNNP